MANFTTHIASGILAGGMLSTLAMAGSAVTPTEVLTLTSTCALGSVLPDVDLNKSRASQAMFSGIGVLLAFAALFNLGMQLSIAEMWILWIGTYVVVRYGGHNLFHRIAVHRGVFHSLLAAAFFAFLAAIVHTKVFGSSPSFGWLAAVFMFIGYVVHLILDEIYSVDIYNERIKASFGSALKLYDGNHVTGSAMMAAAAVGLFLLTPTLDSFLGIFTANETWAYLGDRLLPDDGKWFGVLGEAQGPTAAAPPSMPAATLESVEVQ
jgi:hypothetical protein